MITRVTCRVCDAALHPIFSLGEHYVSDFVLPDEPDGTRAPLDLVLCERCRLLQLKHTVDPGLMYRNYWYRSGTNKTMRDALADIANKAETLIHLEPEDSVLDIGCNDGTLLSAYRTSGIYRIGVDPAENLALYSRKVADKVVVGFFEADAFCQDPDLRARQPKIVTSIAMFYDLEYPRAFVDDIKKVMHPEGMWVVQMSYLPLMLRDNEVGNICHEHLEYYSMQSFEYLLGLSDLEVVDVEINDVNGGSFRTYIRFRGASPERFGDETFRILAAERVEALRDSERKLALSQASPYLEFGMWAERIKNDVTAFVRGEVARGKRVYVYGASTKGNTVLQYYGLGRDVIEAAAERNRDKWGRVTIGTRIPIISEEQARAAKPEYFLVLPWHFVREFQTREREYLVSGGRFILPAPHFTLL
jgi:NDP-4-keto-2,6-dideoxyhexose 3-C-methyltransferase